MKQYSSGQLVLILTPFVFSFALGLDIYIPIIPQMTLIFDTSAAMIQLTLSLFLFITGAGQLVIGPLADRYGRRAIFAFASLCFTFGSLGCALSTHIAWLIAARVISAIGACGMLVTAFAIVRDLFSSRHSAKMYSFLNGAIGISPTFAPVIGGYLAYYLGWQSIFYFLALNGLLALFISWYFIKETIDKAQRVEIDSSIFKRYYDIFSNKRFIVYAALAGLSEGVFFCFFSVSPHLIIDKLGIPTYQFGYYFAVFGIVIALGGLASGKIVAKIGVQKTIAIGLALMLFGGSSMLLWYYLGELSLEGFLLPMVISCTGAIFVVGGAASEALEPFGAIAGTAAAAFGAVEFGISAVGGSLLMLFPTTSTIPYGISIILTAFLSYGLFALRPHHAPEHVLGIQS